MGFNLFIIIVFFVKYIPIIEKLLTGKNAVLAPNYKTKKSLDKLDELNSGLLFIVLRATNGIRTRDPQLGKRCH